MERKTFAFPYWMEQAQALFLDEHDNPEDFYQKYTGAAVLYTELSNRTTITDDTDDGLARAAYAQMYADFCADVEHNNYDRLDKLVNDYQNTK